MAFLFFIIVTPAVAGDNEIFFHEDFNDLTDWKVMEFPRIKKHSIYFIEKNGAESYLKSESNASASAIVFGKTFNVFDFPRVKWRWKISNVYKKGQAGEKAGDDYPIRIFIMFKYDPARASYGERIKHDVARLIFGMEAPYSSLNYIWESKPHSISIITSPYSSESKMVVLQAGSEKAGKWIEEDVNILEDYRKSFGEDPPAVANIAVMNDSDDTGEGSVSYIDYIEVYR